MEQSTSNSLINESTKYFTTESMDITELVNWESKEINSKISELSVKEIQTIQNDQSEILHFNMGLINEIRHLVIEKDEETVLKKFEMDIIWNETLIFNILNQKLHLDYNVRIIYSRFFIFSLNQFFRI